MRRRVDLDGLPVELLGLDDAHIARHDLRVAPRASPERFGIAVMHSPDSAPEAAAFGYDLLVAGHTHGGQVRLPVVGALVTNCSLPPPPRERADPHGELVAARLARPRDEQVRAVPVLLPARGHVAGAPSATGRTVGLGEPLDWRTARDVAQLGSAQRSGR